MLPLEGMFKYESIHITMFVYILNDNKYLLSNENVFYFVVIRPQQIIMQIRRQDRSYLCADCSFPSLGVCQPYIKNGVLFLQVHTCTVQIQNTEKGI